MPDHAVAPTGRRPGLRAGALVRRAYPCMGTVFSFAIRTDDVPRAVRAMEDAMRLLRRLDAAWSPFRPDSLVGRLRRDEQISADTDDPDGELGLDAVLERCSAARWLTRGAFDPWSMPAGFDPSGAVKGWAVERGLQVLLAHGLDDVALGGGGDVAVRGRSAAASDTGWRIGVRDPRDASRLVGRVAIEGGGAVATSGIYERGRHVLDPRTGGGGRPRAASASASAAAGDGDDLVGLSVLGPDLGWADVIATGLLAEGMADADWLDLVPQYRVLAVDARGRLSGSALGCFEVPAA